VNWLLMPHARITIKRTGCMSAESVSAFLAEMDAVAPSRDPLAGDDDCAVIGRTDTLRWSGFNCYASMAPPAMQRLEAALDRLSQDLQVTYSGYPPVEDEEPGDS